MALIEIEADLNVSNLQPTCTGSFSGTTFSVRVYLTGMSPVLLEGEGVSVSIGTEVESTLTTRTLWIRSPWPLRSIRSSAAGKGIAMGWYRWRIL